MTTAPTPKRSTQSEIQSRARGLERLRLKRRAQVKKLADLDADIRTAGKLLRDLIAEATRESDGNVGELPALANGERP